MAIRALEFTETAQNVVLIGGPCTGKTHFATAMAVSAIASQGKRIRFYSKVDLANALGAGEGAGQGGPDCLVADTNGCRHLG